MKTLIMMVGIPGSGKSYFIQKHLKNAIIVSPDQIRERLGDINDQSKNGIVWETAKGHLIEALYDDFYDTVVLDSTMARCRDRRKMIAFAREFGYEKIVGIFINPHYDIAVMQNFGRERQVPAEVLMRMENSLINDPPKLTDGFDDLITIERRI